MSFVVPRIGRSALAALAAGTALSAFAVAPSAEAAFSLQRCTGSDVQGRGATFQDTAHKATTGWATAFRTTTGADTCNGGPQVGYNVSGPNGSGAGRGAMGSGESASTSSGLGLGDGERDNAVRFGGSDEGPTPVAQGKMNAGIAGTADDALVHVVPVAASAVTVVVNYPTWDHDANAATTAVACPIPSSFRQEGPSDGFDRLRLPNWKIENAFAGEFSTWGELLADPDGAGPETGLDTDPAASGSGAAQFEAGCADRKLIRAVRQDSSGTTFAFKDLLTSAAKITNPSNAVLGGTGTGIDWRTDYLANSNANRNWPETSADNDPAGAATRPANSTDVTVRFGNDLSNAYGDIADAANVCEADYVATAAHPVCRSLTTGAGGVRNVVSKNVGAIGYIDLAGGIAASANAPFKKADDANDTTYYLPLAESESLTTYVEPTVNPNGYQAGADTLGANCANVPVKAMPGGADPTVGTGWDKTTMAFPATGDGVAQYSDCTLTYALAFDDNAPVYLNLPGNTYALEEARARTVKDYLSYVVSDAGQATLVANDYAALPSTAPAGTPSALAVARTGVAAIDWDKQGLGNVGDPGTPGQGGDPGQGGNPGTPGTPAPGTPQPAPVVQPPAQQAPVSTFTVGSSRKRGNDLVATFRLPGAGRLQVTASGTYTQKTKRKGKKKATSRKRTVSVGKATVSVTRAGDLSVKLPMSAASRKALGSAKRITVKLTVVFTPAGGTPNTITRTLTLRA